MKIRPYIFVFFTFSAAACSDTPTPAPHIAAAPIQKPDTTVVVKNENLPPVAVETPVSAKKQNTPAQKIKTKSTKKKPAPVEKPATIAVQTAPAQNPVAAQPAKTPAIEIKIETPTPPAAPGAPAHDAWDVLLQKYVRADGKVDYKGFKSDKADLEAYLKTLAENPVQSEWSRAEKMAYWINAYNAFTIKLIVDNYPAKSILNFDGGKTWDVKRITLGGKKYSLNQIENDILRPQYKDARIHFAVNCAARSCPPLYNRAFTAENLENALEARAEAFINNAAYNKISTTKANVSKIFEWYAADFGDLKKYLNKYSKTQLNSSSSIGYNEYDWDLNE